MENPAETASGLTEVLRRGGCLRQGEVLEVQVDRQLETSISNLAFIKAAYSGDAPADLPSALVIKWPLALSEESRRVHRTEIDFYARLAPALPTPPGVRCFAAWRDGTGGGPLVLEDLRNSHDHPPWPIPPSRTQSELALDALARIHAQWWEDPALGETIGSAHSAESLRQMVNGISVHLPSFLEDVGAAISRGGRVTLERVFASSLRPWLRLVEPRALTVAHGDAHSWNFLFPRSGSGPAFLLDWQLWHLDVGARDVALTTCCSTIGEAWFAT